MSRARSTACRSPKRAIPFRGCMGWCSDCNSAANSDQILAHRVMQDSMSSPDAGSIYVIWNCHTQRRLPKSSSSESYLLVVSSAMRSSVFATAGRAINATSTSFTTIMVLCPSINLWWNEGINRSMSTFKNQHPNSSTTFEALAITQSDRI